MASAVGPEGRMLRNVERGFLRWWCSPAGPSRMRSGVAFLRGIRAQRTGGARYCQVFSRIPSRRGWWTAGGRM